MGVLSTKNMLVAAVGVVIWLYLPAEWSMGMSFWLKSVAAAVAGLAVVAQLPTSWWLPNDKATTEYLADTQLRTLDGTDAMVKEAKALSSIKSELTARGIKLYAIVLESLGHKEFQKYFDGTVYLDKKRVFYGPTERRLGVVLGLLNVGMYFKAYNVAKNIKQGNLIGEGRILGGVFVIGPGDQGIVYEERNMDFGATVNVSGVQEAAKLVKPPLDAAKL